MASTHKAARLAMLAIAAALGTASVAAAQTAHGGARIDQVVKPLAMNGIHGLAFGPDGDLYAASITGKSLYRIDPATGRARVFVGPPDGGADDLTFSPQGDPVWTGGPDMNAVMTRTRAGGIHALVGKTPGVNAVRFSSTGRLFFTRLFAGDGLYELDPSGVRPPRIVAEGIGGLNSFDFMPDGSIVGPLFMKGSVVHIDVETGKQEIVAEGFQAPSSVRRLADGMLVLNYRSGEIWRVDDAGGRRRLVATVDGPADNMTLGPKGRLYVSSTAHNGVTEIDLATGRSRRVTWSDLSAPGLVSAAVVDGAERILIADEWGARTYDPATRQVQALAPGGFTFAVRSIIGWKDGYAFTSSFSPGTVLVTGKAAGKPIEIKGFKQPTGLLATAQGLLVADFQAGQVVRVHPAAPDQRTVIASGLAGPLALAQGADGAVFVSEYAAGRVTRLGGGPVATGLQRPEGIAMAKDGRLIVVETGSRQLVAVDPASGRRQVIADHLAVGLAQARTPDGPFLATGVAVASDGAIYVPGNADNALYRIRLR